MATCDDRQLSQAELEAGFDQQQQAGVAQQLRPFSGQASPQNLMDYLNREVLPVLRATRQKLNDVYQTAVQNAPSANPLTYYFSSNTATADPTVGRIRLDASPQATAAHLLISETNARLKDATEWLTVMSEGATVPLGVITLSDLVNPSRFLRFNLSSMVDSGAYWTLAVAAIDGSSFDPFVDGEAVSIGFLPGHADGGVTIPPTALSPISPDTFIGNITGSVAPPTQNLLSDIAGDGLGFAGHQFKVNVTNNSLTIATDNVVRTALTGDITAAQDISVTAFRSFIGLSVLGRSANSSGVPTEVSAVAASGSVLRESGSTIGFGTITLAAFPSIANDTFLANVSGSTAQPTAVNLSTLAGAGLAFGTHTLDVTGSTSITITSDQVQRAALTGDVTAALNVNTTAFRTFAADTYLGNITTGSAVPTDNSLASLAGAGLGFSSHAFLVNTGTSITVATDTVVRAALTGDITASQDSNTTAFRSFSALSVLGRSANSSGIPTEIAASAASDAVLRESGSTIGFGTIATGGIANNAVTNAKLAQMAARRVKGRADAAGTGDPQDLTANQLGAILRLGNEAADTTSSGTVTAYSVASGINTLTFNGTTSTLHSIAAPTESGQLLIISHIGAGSLTLVQDSTTETTAANRLSLGDAYAQNSTPIVLSTATFNRSAVFIYYGVRWQYVGDAVGALSILTGNIANNAVDNTKIRDSGALSVIGRSANSSGDPADISAVAASGSVLVETGSTLAFSTVATAGITNNAVTDAKLRQGGALSVIGRSANSTGNVADIAASAASDAVLRESGSTVGFGTIATGGIAASAVTNAKLANMTARTVKGRADSAGTGAPQDLTANQLGAIIRIGNEASDTTSSGTVTSYVVASGINVLTFNGTTCSLHGIVAPTETGQLLIMKHIGAGSLSVVQDSTSETTAANRFNMGDYSQNSSPLVFSSTTLCQGAIFVYFGARWQWIGDAYAAGQMLTAALANNAVTDTKLRDSGALSVIGRSANSTGDPADIAASAASDAVLRESGSTIGFGTIATGGIANNAVTYAKIQQGSARSVLAVAGTSTANYAELSTTSGSAQVLTENGSGSLVFGQVATAGIVNSAVSAAKVLTSDTFSWSGAHTFNSSVTFNNVTSLGGTVQYTAVISPTTLSAGQDNYNPTGWGTANHVRLITNNSTLRTLTGAAAGGVGEVKIISNVGVPGTNAPIQFAHESASSTAANRFRTDSGTAINLNTDSWTMILYDSTSSRWRLMSPHGA